MSDKKLTPLQRFNRDYKEPEETDQEKKDRIFAKWSDMFAGNKNRKKAGEEARKRQEEKAGKYEDGGVVKGDLLKQLQELDKDVPVDLPKIDEPMEEKKPKKKSFSKLMKILEKSHR